MKSFIVCTLILALGIPQSICQSLRTFINADDRDITTSGFSSGGTFSQQLQFSYPSLFTGIAVFSHTYYRCGPPSGIQEDYDRVCTKLFNATDSQQYHNNIERVHDAIKADEKNNLIGKTSSLKDKRLYVFTGLRNFLFSPEMSLSILRVYERYIKNPEAIRTRVMDAALVMPTHNNRAPSCTTAFEQQGNDFNANCGFSGAYEALNFLLGHRVSNKPRPGQRITLQPLQEFDQEEFTAGIPNHNMDKKGYLYVPKACLGRPICLLHFFFHGCLNGREFVKDKFIKGSGYLEVAELNNIIMVFPQAVKSLPQNDIGCWDTFGISGPRFPTREGAQVKAVKKMIDRVIGNSGHSHHDAHPTYQTTTKGWGKG